MKNKRIITSILFGFIFSFLSGCVSINSSQSSSTSSKTTPTFTSSTLTTKPEEITIFSINDLHGSLKESPSDGELGVAKLDYALKHDEDYNPDTSIIISSGDMWEGGYLSHEDKYLTDDVLAKMGVEAMVLGNHDFSWGIDTIKQLRAKSKYPYLACNIANENGRHVNDFSDNYTIIEKAGLKVGVIGVASAESSITSSALEGYTFSENISLVRECVRALENEKCDITVLAIHNNYEYKFTSEIANNFTQSQISGIFGAHTHQFEKETIGSNKIPYLQAGCNSKGYAKMTFSLPTKKVKSFSYNSNVYNDFNNTDNSSLNQDILNKINEADLKYNPTETICEFDTKFRRYYELNKFIPYVMMGEAKRLGWTSKNKFLALHNLAGIRSDIPSGKATKEILFKTEPFDNKVKVIPNVKGSALSSTMGVVESAYKTDHYAYMCEDEQEFSTSKTYDIITIDYVCESKYWKINNPRYNLDRTNNNGNNNNNKVKYIFDTMIDFIKSEGKNGSYKIYHGSDFKS